VGDTSQWATSSFTTLEEPSILAQVSIGEEQLDKNDDSNSFSEDVIDLRSESNVQELPSVVDAQVKVFPNPANESVNIQINQAHFMNTITLYDLSGRALHRIEGIQENYYQLQLGASISAGMYILKIEGENFSEVRRLVITR
jgi:hypothetical protein